jgi:REP element-mobilizing transposase RayT
LYHFAGQRYHLLAYVIMPSHIHWVFHPLEAWCQSLPEAAKRRTPREIILHSTKSFTANACNKLLARKGQFWQDESFDHWVRGEDELARIIQYVEQNPVKAGLISRADLWEFSSARDRVAWGIPLGEALIAPVG